MFIIINFNCITGKKGKKKKGGGTDDATEGGQLVSENTNLTTDGDAIDEGDDEMQSGPKTVSHVTMVPLYIYLLRINITENRDSESTSYIPVHVPPEAC